MNQQGTKAAYKIKDKEPERPHYILNVVCKNPHCPHIAQKMEPTAVQKHIRYQRIITTSRIAHPPGPFRVGKSSRYNSEKMKKFHQLNIV
jgi:hypothetical protein